MFKASLRGGDDFRNMHWDWTDPMSEEVAAEFSSLCNDWMDT
tara:strand:+ start:313 stop:438 length:126 start_codon:yes stop_codon:yes gene_type:complete